MPQALRSPKPKALLDAARAENEALREELDALTRRVEALEQK